MKKVSQFPRRTADPTEAWAIEYFRHCGFEEIIFEPNGNRPPDILLDGDIAVEVRRLNQAFTNQTTTTDLDSDGIPFSQRMRNLVLSIEDDFTGPSFFISYDFQRPLPKWKAVQKNLPSLVRRAARNVDMQQEREILVAKNLSISIHQASRRYETPYVIGGWIDDNSGGWILHEMERNIRRCMAEKEAKIRPHQAEYRKWWLALVDGISFGLERDDIDELRKDLPTLGPWEKVFILHHRDHSRSFSFEN